MTLYLGVRGATLLLLLRCELFYVALRESTQLLEETQLSPRREVLQNNLGAPEFVWPHYLAPMNEGTSRDLDKHYCHHLAARDRVATYCKLEHATSIVAKCSYLFPHGVPSNVGLPTGTAVVAAGQVILAVGVMRTFTIVWISSQSSDIVEPVTCSIYTHVLPHFR